MILDRFRDLINDADTGVFQNVIGIGQGFSFPRVKRYTIVPNAQNNIVIFVYNAYVDRVTFRRDNAAIAKIHGQL